MDAAHSQLTGRSAIEKLPEEGAEIDTRSKNDEITCDAPSWVDGTRDTKLHVGRRTSIRITLPPNSVKRIADECRTCDPNDSRQVPSTHLEPW